MQTQTDKETKAQRRQRILAEHESAKKRTTYWKEKAVLDFTEEIVNRMQALTVSRSQLAERISAKPAFVTKVLRGDNNFTVETMVKIGRALNSRVRVHLEPDGMDSEWLKTYGAGKFYSAFMSIAQNAEGTCVHCDQPIYLDIREGGGIPDWRTLDGDYGCNFSPENEEDGCGGHIARKGNI